MAREGRPLIRIIFQNFINSFRPRQLKGNYMGEDYLGNKYYEIPADPSRGKRKTSRYFEPPGERDRNDPDDHGHELTAEWESWLRGRRKEPPTEEELKRNLAIMQMKKKNAELIEGKSQQLIDHASIKTNKETGRAEFPRYDEDYEISAGTKPIKKE